VELDTAVRYHIVVGRVIFGALAGIGLCLTLGALWLAREPCGGRCGPTTRCEAHRCVVAPAAVAPPEKTKERRRRAHRPGEPAAAAEVQLQPGDDQMLAAGDALGRPEHVDLTRPGDDGRELTDEDLERLFRPSEPAISRCITDALGDAPLETGKVEVGLRVEASGAVSRVRIQAPSLLVRHGLLRCVRAAVGALRFPASGGANVVTYPFELK
jgi:hypothetical protein